MKIWKTVRETKFSFNVSEYGVIGNFKVPEKIAQTVKEHGSGYGISADDLLGSLIVAVVQLPAKPVVVGDEWEMNVIIAPMESTDNSQKGTFLGTAVVDEKTVAVLQIEFHSRMEKGSAMISEFESSSKTIVLFDIAGGSIWRLYTIAEGEMVLNLRGNEVFQTTIGKSTVTRLN